ncbi:hypothetical protein EVAR_42548_1 [Eumeta japonica]|uniref:Uncharacterized protein n=1 Tax=Eumeta variegata TaxID=151549 RepID=A0A4C1WSL7_EUMVA|nr:hypothetical protein EVAR_42548_1 [Eumeta japonica]
MRTEFQLVDHLAAGKTPFAHSVTGQHVSSCDLQPPARLVPHLSGTTVTNKKFSTEHILHVALGGGEVALILLESPNSAWSLNVYKTKVRGRSRDRRGRRVRTAGAGAGTGAYRLSRRVYL